MKPLGIFLSFVMLNVVMANELDEEYKKQVYITNKCIKRSVGSRLLFLPYQTTHLMTVVKNIVLEEHTMVEIALMLVVPERQDLVVIEQETQENVSYVNDETSPLLGVPEQQVAVIEHEKLLSYQKKVQSEIETATGVNNAPAIDEGSLRRANLENLGNKRRRITSAAVNRLIDAIFVRRIPRLKSAFSDFPKLCRLLGLHKCLRNVFHKLPIIESANVHNEICILEDLDKNQTRYKLLYDNNYDVQFQTLSF